MTEKLLLLVIVYGLILGQDGSRLRKLGGRERFVYGLLMVLSLYLSLDYLLQKNWFNLDDGIRLILKEPAKYIVGHIKVPPE